MIKKVLMIAGMGMLASNIAFADVSGNWSFAVNIPGAGSGNAQVTLEDAGNGTLKGNYSGQLGNTPVNGTTDGTKFEFALESDFGAITYSGSLQEDGTLKGTLDLAGQGSGSFTGTKR